MEEPSAVSRIVAERVAEQSRCASVMNAIERVAVSGSVFLNGVPAVLFVTMSRKIGRFRATAISPMLQLSF